MSSVLKLNIDVDLCEIIKTVFHDNLATFNSNSELTDDGGKFWAARVKMNIFDQFQGTQIAAFYHPTKSHGVRVAHENPEEERYERKAHGEAKAGEWAICWAPGVQSRGWHNRATYYLK
jgi:hypothetical protein